MRNKILALVFAFLAANPAAALSPATALPRYQDSAGDSRARAAAVYDNGDVLFVGHINGGIGPVVVRLDPTMGTVRWRKVLSAYSGMSVQCVAVSGEIAVIGGGDFGATAGRLVALDAAGNAFTTSLSYATNGYRDIAT